MWKWRPLGGRTTHCIQFIMLLRDEGEGVRVEIEIGSNRKKTGPKETPIALIAPLFSPFSL